MQVTEDAETAYVHDHAEALTLLDEITNLIQDLPAPGFEGFEPNWGHVAELNQAIAELTRVRDRLDEL